MENGVFIFASQEERDRYQLARYGRLRYGFRLPEEPPEGPNDSRPVLVWQPFWRSEGERLTYETAVQKNPKRPDEGPMAYASRIASIVTGAYQQAGLEMPRRGMSQKEWRDRQWQIKREGLRHEAAEWEVRSASEGDPSSTPARTTR